MEEMGGGNLLKVRVPYATTSCGTPRCISDAVCPEAFNFENNEDVFI
jgi:hypothetical protein